MSKSLIVVLTAASLLAVMHARAEDLEHKAVLNLTIVTPQGQPDLQRMLLVKDLDECWETAKAWVQSADIEKHKDALGLAAGCGLVKQPSTEN